MNLCAYQMLVLQAEVAGTGKSQKKPTSPFRLPASSASSMYMTRKAVVSKAEAGLEPPKI